MLSLAVSTAVATCVHPHFSLASAPGTLVGGTIAEPMEAMFDRAGFSAGEQCLNDLILALQRLDRLLERAVAVAQTVYKSEATADPYRGLYISQDEVEQLLIREPGASTLHPDGQEFTEPLANSVGNTSQLAWLQQSFSLSTFDIDLILIALAPEIDLRYERLYAYLQDDVTRRRPSVDLALSLLCPSAAMKLARRIHFAANAPLIRNHLLYLIPDPNQLQPPLLAYHLKLDEQIIQRLLGQESLDARLVPFCQSVRSTVLLEELPLNTEMQQALRSLVLEAWETRQPLRLYFHGPYSTGKRYAAEALAGKVGAPLLVVNLAQALTANIDFQQLLKLLFREAWFQNALLYLDDLDALRQDQWRLQYQDLLDALVEDPGITFLAAVQPWRPSEHSSIHVIAVPFSIPSFAQRRADWQAKLAKAGISSQTHDLDALANHFRLTPDQIGSAIATAQNQVRWRAASQSPEELIFQSRHLSHQPTLNDLFLAARAQCGHDLAALARKIEPKFTWDDIVLAADPLAQLREICNQAKYRQIVGEEWGFDRKLPLGKGLNILFSGPPGTGKTMAAEVIAHELQLDLYKIDLSQIVSKYIGETEKNLDRIFTVAENANAILLFDEADALFGKRSEVKDAHDRYANIEIAYLLQKMEEYQGITILTTNLRQNLDEAFSRRLRFIVEFPFPEEEYRLRIWQGIWPQEMPLGADVDLQLIAQQFKLTGGNIRNIALAAAFLAAANGQCVGMQYLLKATRREFQKMGRLVSQEEFLKFQSVDEQRLNVD